MNRILLPLRTLCLSLAAVPGWAAGPSADQAEAITEIAKSGGKVAVDAQGPGKPAIAADPRETRVADVGLASLKGLSEARSFIAAATREVDKITDDGDRDYVLYDVAGMQAMLGDIEGAKATASACSVSGRRSETYRYIGELQGALGDKQGARQTLLLSRKAALAARSADQKDRSWLDLGLLAIDHARIGDCQGASETLQLIEDAKEREEYQSGVAHFQSEEEARTTIKNIKDPFQRDLAVKDIVDSQLRSENRAGAWASAKEIADLGLRTSAYIMIAEAQRNTNDARRAYEQSKATAEEIRRIDNKSEPTMMIPGSGDREFHEIAASQARTGDVAGAKATAALVRDPTEKAASFIDVACAQLTASDRQGARVTLTNAVTARTTATSNYHFMQQLAVALAAAGDLSEAMKTVSLMDDHGEPRDHAYEQVIDILLDDRKIKQAKETIGFISDPRWKATALARIGAAQSSAGDMSAARKTFAEARSITATVPARSPESWTWDRSSVYHDVAMREAETGDYEEIKRWIPQVREQRERVSSWLGAAWPLAHQYYDDGQKKMARKAEQDGATRPKVP